MCVCVLKKTKKKKHTSIYAADACCQRRLHRAYIYVYMSIYVCICVYMCVCVLKKQKKQTKCYYICKADACCQQRLHRAYIFVYMSIHVCVCVYMCVYVCICVYMCVCVGKKTKTKTTIYAKQMHAVNDDSLVPNCSPHSWYTLDESEKASDGKYTGSGMRTHIAV